MKQICKKIDYRKSYSLKKLKMYKDMYETQAQAKIY